MVPIFRIGTNSLQLIPINTHRIKFLMVQTLLLAAPWVLIFGNLAPQAMAKTYTLSELLQRAKQDTIQQQILGHERDRQKAETESFKSFALPSLSFEVGSSRDGTALTNPYVGGGPGAPDRSYDTTHRWNLQFRSILYSFGRTGTVFKLARERGSLSDIQHASSVDEYHHEVVRQYAECQLLSNRLRAAQRSLAYAEQLAKYIETEHQGGGASQIDLLRSQANLGLARSRAEMIQAQHSSANMALKVLLALESEGDFTIAAEKPDATAIVSRANKLALDQGAGFKSKQERLMEKNLEIAQLYAGYQAAQVWPSLSVLGGVNSRIRSHGFLADPDAPSYGDLWEEERFNYSVGLALTWTLFDGFKIQADAKQAYHAKAISERQLAQFRSQLPTMVASAKEQYLASRSLMTASDAAFRASELNFHKIDEDFKSGQSSLTERLEAEKDWQESETTLFEAYAQVLESGAQLLLLSGEEF